MSDMKVSVIIDAVNRIGGPVKSVINDLNKVRDASDRAGQLKVLRKSVNNVTTQFGRVTGEIGKLSKGLAAAAGVGGFIFKRTFIDTAAEFERFKTILETTEGSSAAAQKSMDWISDFATSTPFELAEVTDAFVKLRAYGLDPTSGLLKTLGDTGAAMGKPVMQAVEAIADAVTGENERLKEFGIKASKAGGKITYEYTNADGEQMTKTVDASNREMIESTLTAIWNEKYSGAMDKLSKTWAGMMSNIADQWTRFVNMVMETGLFDWMKSKLKGLLDQIDALAASGQLKALAEQFGQKLMRGFKAAWEAASQLWSGLKAGLAVIDNLLTKLSDITGIDKTTLALSAIAAVIAGPLIAALVSLGTAVGAALIMFAGFAGWWALIPVGIGVAAGLIIKYWDNIKQAWSSWMADIESDWQALSTFWDSLPGQFMDGWDGLTGFFTELWDGIARIVGEKIDWIVSKINWVTEQIDGIANFGKNLGTGIVDSVTDTGKDLWRGTKEFFRYDSPTPSGPAIPTGQPLSHNLDAGGTIRLQIDSKEPVRVREIQPNSNRMDFDVITGRSMGLVG